MPSGIGRQVIRSTTVADADVADSVWHERHIYISFDGQSRKNSFKPFRFGASPSLGRHQMPVWTTEFGGQPPHG